MEGPIPLCPCASAAQPDKVRPGPNVLLRPLQKAREMILVDSRPLHHETFRGGAVPPLAFTPL